MSRSKYTLNPLFFKELSLLELTGECHCFTKSVSGLAFQLEGNFEVYLDLG